MCMPRFAQKDKWFNYCTAFGFGVSVEILKKYKIRAADLESYIAFILDKHKTESKQLTGHFND